MFNTGASPFRGEIEDTLCPSGHSVGNTLLEILFTKYIINYLGTCEDYFIKPIFSNPNLFSLKYGHAITSVPSLKEINKQFFAENE